MKIYRFDKLVKEAMDKCDFTPLDAPTRIDSQSLIYDVLNLHFKDDTLQAEESDIPIRLQDYGFYDLQLLNMGQLRDVDSIEYAPVDINEDNIEDNMNQIISSKTYPPIVVDVMGHVIDGYHRVFALKQIGCTKVWAYVPDKSTYNDPNADFEDFDEEY